MWIKNVWRLCLVALLFAALPGLAQDDMPTLRALADELGIYIGAAVYTSHLRNDAHVETLAREFNMLTPENEAKACEVQPSLGRFNFVPLDELMAFAEAHEMAVHGHTLLWHQCVPDWLANGTYTREEAIGLLRDHIYTVVGRYKGRIAIWDVVNEAVNDDGQGLRDTPWHRLIGDDYVELAFQFAHEADPDALLFYNDYGGEGINNKSNAIYEMVADFVERGIPIHGVGLQGHFTLGGFSVGGIAENIRRLGELGLQVQFTEIDVRFNGSPTEQIAQQQAGDYHKLMNLCLDSEYCTAFITWGVSDRFTWLRGRNLGFYDNPEVTPLLFDDNYQPKLAYRAVLDALARRAGRDPILTDSEVDALYGRVTTPVAIPEPTKSDPAQLSPDSVPGTIYYAPFPLTITLDGATDDWANVPRVTVENGTMIPAGNDTSLTFAAAADAAHLYFLAEVQDSKLVYGLHDPSSGWYEEDSVEFYINATGDLDATVYSPGIAQIGILAANVTQPDAPIVGGGGSDTAQVSVFAIETETGYIIEASVPLVTDVWEITPEHEGVLGFQVHLNGSSGENRDTKLIWSNLDTQDQSWTNPSVFGQLIFWAVGE